MVTVGSLAYSIVANTQNFTAGVAASKAELRTLKDAFLASQSDADKYSTAIEHLENLAQKFPEKAGPLHATIHKMREEMHEAASRGTLLGGVWEHLKQHTMLVIDPIHLAEKAFEGVKEAIHATVEKVESLNRLGLKAGALGIDPGELIGLAGAAKELTGLDFDSFSNMMTMFSKNIGQAAEEAKGPAFEAFERLGLSVDGLAKMPADKALNAVSEALSRVHNSFERTFLAKEIGGKLGPQFVQFLAAGDEKISEIAAHVKELEHTDLIDNAAIHEAAVALEDMHHSFTGVANIAANEFAPVIKEIASDLTGWSGDGERLQSVFHVMANAVDTTLFGFKEIGNLPFVKWVMSHSGASPVLGVLSQMSAVADIRHQLQGQEGFGGGFYTASERKNLDAGQKEFDQFLEKRRHETDEQYRKEQQAEKAIAKDKLDAINRAVEIEGRAYEQNEKRAEQIAKSHMNGAEKLREEFEKVQELEAGGFFDLHPGAHAEALNDLRDKASEMARGGDFKGITSAVTSASREGIAARFGMNNDTAQERRAKKAEEQRNVAATLLGKIEAAVKGIPTMGVVP